MTITPHIFVGAACGVACKFLPVSFSLAVGAAFFIGLFSHFVLDSIPHHDPETYLDPRQNRWKIFCIALADIVIGVALGLWALRFKSSPVYTLGVVGAVAGTVPDIFDNLFCRFLFPCLSRTFLGRHFIRIHGFCHTTTPRARWILGITTQVLSMAGSSAVLALS